MSQLVMRATLAVVLTLCVSLDSAAQQTTLTLEEAVALALQRNERARIAEEEIEAAEARVERARAFFFPDLNINGNYTRRMYETVREIGDEQVTIQSFNALSATANVTQTIFDARAFPLYRYARLLSEATRLGSGNDKRIVAFDAAEAFILTLSQQRVVDAAVRRRQLAAVSVDDARARFEAGLVSSNDLTRAELELTSADLLLTRARNSLFVATRELANLIGAADIEALAEPESLIQTAEATSPTPPDTETIISQRLDLLSLRANARALREFAKEPSRRIIPTLTFNGQYRRTNEGGLSGREGDGFLAVNMGWNLFDGGERSADRAERRSLTRIAELNASAAERQARTEVETAAANVTAEQQSIQQAELAADVARRNASETAELYRQGLAGSLEVADASLRRYEAEVAESQARYELALAFLSWRYAIGEDPLGREMNDVVSK